jgi:hypothetical protein
VGSNVIRVVSVFLLALAGLAYGQANEGALHLVVTDATGHGITAAIHVANQGIQYSRELSTSADGVLELNRLPFGKYHLDVRSNGFTPVQSFFEIRSRIPTQFAVQMKIGPLTESVKVSTTDTLLATDQAGSIDVIGKGAIRDRLGSVPGRSIQDLVNTQPGWIFEGNTVLHPRESEYQTQFIVNGVPLTDNRSPSFGPEIEADGVQSLGIYTAGIPAEYGRKMGGVIEVNTIRDAQSGLHGQIVLAGGSLASVGGSGDAQYSSGKNTLGGSVSSSRTDHYLNPVVPQNFTNTGTIGDFSASYLRAQTPRDSLSFSVRHEFSRFDIPNEMIQQAAGQLQTGDNAETMGIASYQHLLSDHAALNFDAMGRDNSSNFYSNKNSTPIEVFQHNSFSEGYFKFSATLDHGAHEWKAGVDSDNTFLHENFNYIITDPSRFDDDTPPTFSFTGSRPDLEQSVFVQDLFRVRNWTISAGLRWDHYQLLLNQQALEPRFAISHYFPDHGLVFHFAYDRVFQTPSSENILLSSSTEVESLDPENFLRLPVKPSVGNYYEAGVSKEFAKQLRFDANYFRRNLNDFADDDQIESTTISFPIAFRKGIIYGLEGKIEIPNWHGVSGFGSYSYSVGNAWFPVTGGLFLGDDATAAISQSSGHFPISQDQRNTFRGRLRYQVKPRFWVAGGAEFNSGLPFEFVGDPATVLAQYGPEVLGRLNFERGRIDPSLKISATAGATLHRSDRWTTILQLDGINLTNTLDVLDFGGLFSGNAIGPPRSAFARLTTTF